MGKLDGACTYLSGAMEFVTDHGVAWRRKFISLSQAAGLKIDYIDPTEKPGGCEIKIGENKQHQLHLKEQGRWEELQNYVQQYRRFDLRFTDLSDFLVVGISPGVPQWGTSNEVYIAETQHKPMFFICEGRLKNLPNWLFALIELEDKKSGKHGNVFNTVEDVVQELCLYNDGTIPMSDEWVLVRKHIEHQRQLQRVK
jgi:hypothetical protein